LTLLNTSDGFIQALFDVSSQLEGKGVGVFFSPSRHTHRGTAV